MKCQSLKSTKDTQRQLFKYYVKTLGGGVGGEGGRGQAKVIQLITINREGGCEVLHYYDWGKGMISY